MKTLKLFAAITLLLASWVVSYEIGKSERTIQNEKDYQAACILSDCCRNIVDNLGVNAEEIYCDYLDYLECDSNLIITREDMDEYYYMY